MVLTWPAAGTVSRWHSKWGEMVLTWAAAGTVSRWHSKWGEMVLIQLTVGVLWHSIGGRDGLDMSYCENCRNVMT